MIKFKWNNKTIRSTERTDNILISILTCGVVTIILKIIELNLFEPCPYWLI